MSTQLLTVIFTGALFYQNIEIFAYEEKIIACFIIAIFAYLYIGGVYKFVSSFYEIIKTSKIDDSDLITVDMWITFALGSLFVLNGIAYMFFSEVIRKNNAK